MTEGKHEGSSMPPEKYQDEAKLPRVSIDLKIPLWGLMGFLGVGAMLLAQLYFTVIRVADDVVELKASVKASNAETIKFAQEQALLRFRIEKLEERK